MAEDARVRKTKQKLSAALVGLLQEKAFCDITPAQICEKAGINRSTFYRNYKNITQLKTEMENKVLSGVQWSGKLTDGAVAQKNIAGQLAYMKENKDLFQALSASGFQEDIFDKIEKRAIAQAREAYPAFETTAQADAYEDLSTYTICGAVGLIKAWFVGGMKQDVDSFAEFLAGKIVAATAELDIY